MKILSTFKNRIFLRIYTGLLLLCMFVAVIAYLLLNTVNNRRAQKYREELATGTFYILTQDIYHQPNEKQRAYFLSDASTLFGTQLKIEKMTEINFSSSELSRLEKDLSVVRFNNKDKYAYIFHKIPKEKIVVTEEDSVVTEEDSVVTAKLSQIDEQKVRALGVFLLDDLARLSEKSDKDKRLRELSEKFPFPIVYKDINEIKLDKDQMSRLNANGTVVLFKNGTSRNATTIDILIPSETPGKIIKLGPINLFNWFPLELVAAIVIFSMFFISLGVYALIFPLEKKLQLLQSGLNDVSEGKLDTRLVVYGEDETAKLSATFNAMAAHIKRLIESQRELTRAVSHELRTPVSRIRFAVDMLADTDDEESRQTQRDFIDQDIEELNGLIDEILTYAKLEEGSPKMNWEIVNLKELLEQVVRETNALGKNIDISATYSNIRMFAEADKRYLHRVVQNLVGNALRYAENKIIISAGVKKGIAFVSVEDDGNGIPEDDRAKVFIPFARLDDSRTRSSGGYGLGLSIVSRICFWFNGHMSVDESPELKGARFVMDWPVKQLTKTIVADELTQEHNERKIIDERE